MTAARNLVLDTNTVMALWHFKDPALESLSSAIDAGTLKLFSRDDALEEFRRVLAYSQFSISPDDQTQLFDTYRNRINPAPATAVDALQLPACRDRDDQKFVEIARDAGVDHLLTRDKLLLKLARHSVLRDRFRILTPERFIAEGLC
ncbi:MAG: PIN family protein [Azoarcus sp.]|nr:MAG: PIN family protein [Azoarcus sp.]